MKRRTPPQLLAQVDGRALGENFENDGHVVLVHSSIQWRAPPPVQRVDGAPWSRSTIQVQLHPLEVSLDDGLVNVRVRGVVHGDLEQLLYLGLRIHGCDVGVPTRRYIFLDYSGSATMGGQTGLLDHFGVHLGCCLRLPSRFFGGVLCGKSWCAIGVKR